LVVLSFIVITSATDCLQLLVSKMIYWPTLCRAERNIRACSLALLTAKHTQHQFANPLDTVQNCAISSL